jgi:asparagine synthase (glutamine-hydrolysing)
MSGILGVWNSQKPTPWQKMLEDLKVLGANGQGDWHDPSVGLSLGRTQLFNTPESCLEPPVVEFQGCVLVWDGRLDNRDSLLLGRSDVTDAQLIIESYRRWGVDCLSHLTGEFSFILWDALRDLLFVGCDVVGGRTLAYFWDGQTLLLSSRVLTLLFHPQVSRELDPLYVAHTLCNFWAHPPGLTPFAKIKRLRPGFALMLQSGKLQQRKVGQLTKPDRYESPRSSEIYYEEFWHLLDRSVKDRLRNHRPVCTTLSGGLDSTTVTISLLNYLPTIDAFSNITTIFPEFDERKSIQSFLEQYPQVRWHGINGDRAWALSEPWERLPATDDPLVACTLAMDLQLFEQMQQVGYGLVFDGDWGDNLFYVDLQDLVKAGSWQQVYKHLSGQSRWHSLLWKELILPKLPQFWRTKWFAKWRKLADPMPPWIASRFKQQPEMEIAVNQYFESFLSANLWESLVWRIESPGSLGALQAYRLLRNFYQLESTSPFQDRRLIEFALNLPPSIQYHSDYNKIFLRKANQNNFPSDVLWRSKDNYFDPLHYAGLGKGESVLVLLEKLQNSSLSEFIDVLKAKESLDRYRQDYASNYCPGKSFQHSTASNLYSLFTFVNWYQRLERYTYSQ